MTVDPARLAHETRVSTQRLDAGNATDALSLERGRDIIEDLVHLVFGVLGLGAGLAPEALKGGAQIWLEVLATDGRSH